MTPTTIPTDAASSHLAERLPAYAPVSGTDHEFLNPEAWGKPAPPIRRDPVDFIGHELPRPAPLDTREETGTGFFRALLAVIVPCAVFYVVVFRWLLPWFVGVVEKGAAK